MYTNPTPALGAGAATGGTLATAILRIVPRRRRQD
jgi:hypothetical protein